MTSSFEARITVARTERAQAIFDSISTDEKFYPENPTRTRMRLAGDIIIEIESGQISHMRANLNSTLRLVLACHEAIGSAGEQGRAGAGTPGA